MMSLSVHIMMTADGRVCVLCCMTNRSRLHRDTNRVFVPRCHKKTLTCVPCARNVFFLLLTSVSSFVGIVSSARTVVSLSVVAVAEIWHCTGQLIQERNLLTVLFVANDLHEVCAPCESQQNSPFSFFYFAVFTSGSKR